MEFLTDESLIVQVQNGQVDACGLLYKRYRKILFTYFYNNIGSKEKSEDLVQITFEKIIKYNKNFSGRSTFKQWLFSVAKNAFIDDYHKRKKQKTNVLENHLYDFGHSDHQEKSMIKDDKMAMLHSAMNRLDPEKRELISMVKLNEKKYKEVAKLYGWTEANVKVKIFRIMKELKEIMAGYHTEYKD